MSKIAVIGAGPVGVEAAARLSLDNHDVDLYEREHPGANVERWSHVTFFSPWKLNRSTWGEELLRAAGHPLEDADTFPTGGDYLDRYLRPLLETDALANCVQTNAEVLGITREGTLKGEFIGDDRRGERPFLLLLSEDSEERYEEADVVIDTSGVYGTPNRLGPGGLSAIGEDRFQSRIERRIPDPTGADRDVYAGKRVLVVGAGHSAVTSLKLLRELQEDDPATHIVWVFRQDTSPYEVTEDDPLPERLSLSRFGNDAALGKVEGITPVIGACVRALRPTEEDAIAVEVDHGGDTQTFTVDRIVSNTGYRPDTEMTRELQVHHCWASEGPMKLAATLLASSGSADCLDQSSGGIDTLRNPEPNFFVLGSKSYGRNSQFLLKVGFEQIEEVASTLD